MKYLAVSFIFFATIFFCLKTVNVKLKYNDIDGVAVLNLSVLKTFPVLKIRISFKDGLKITLNEKKLKKAKKNKNKSVDKAFALKLLSFIKIKSIRFNFTLSLGDPASTVVACNLLSGLLYGFFRFGQNLIRADNCFIQYRPDFEKDGFCLCADADISLKIISKRG